MADDQKRPASTHKDDPVEETVHAGCGLPVLAGLLAMVVLFNT